MKLGRKASGTAGCSAATSGARRRWTGLSWAVRVDAVRFTGDEVLSSGDALIGAFRKAVPDSLSQPWRPAASASLSPPRVFMSYSSRPLTLAIQFQAKDHCHQIGRGKRVDVIIPTRYGHLGLPQVSVNPGPEDVLPSPGFNFEGDASRHCVSRRLLRDPRTSATLRKVVRPRSHRAKVEQVSPEAVGRLQRCAVASLSCGEFASHPLRAQ